MGSLVERRALLFPEEFGKGLVTNMDLFSNLGARYGLVIIVCVSAVITEALMSMVDLADSLLSAVNMPEDLTSEADLKDCLISMVDFV